MTLRPEYLADPATPDDISYDLLPLVANLQNILRLVTATKPLYLFLDALDQLIPAHDALDLNWLPWTLPDDVRLVVSTTLPRAGDEEPQQPTTTQAQISGSPAAFCPGASVSSSAAQIAIAYSLKRHTSAEDTTELEPMSRTDAAGLLSAWLASENRTLQPTQKHLIMSVFEREGNPLWLRIAAIEAGRYADWQELPTFLPDAPGLIQQVLDRLSADENHGRVLVKRSLSYVVSGRHGLAEDELIDVLSRDLEVMADFRRRSPQSPPVESLPVVIWAALHGDLARYLTEREAQGAHLLRSYHHGFLEAVQIYFLGTHAERSDMHRRLAMYFGDPDWFIAPPNESGGTQHSPTITDPPDVRKASELPWQLLRIAALSVPGHDATIAWDAVETVVCNMEFVEAKCRAGLLLELQEDYRSTLATLPETQDALRWRSAREDFAHQWTEAVISYARGWSAVRDGAGARPALSTPEYSRVDVARTRGPAFPYLRLSQERSDRIEDSSPRTGRISTFARFVASQFYPLVQFGMRPGFACQQAFNWGPVGPLRDAAALLTGDISVPWVERAWPIWARWNPQPAELRTLEGHKGSVHTVCVTPDGHRAVSCGEDGTLRVWDLESGACLRIIESHHPIAMCVSATPDCRRAISCGAGGALRVWDLESGACILALEAGSAICVSITPDGRRAISGGTDKIVRVWDLESGACTHTLKGHSETVNSVSVTPDGRLAVSGSSDRTVRVWNPGSGECLRVLEGHALGVRSVDVTADGDRAISGGDDGLLRVWDLESGRCQYQMGALTGRILCVNVTLDGRRAFTGSDDNTLRVWDLENSECLRTLEGHASHVNSVSVAVCGDQVVSCSDDETLRVWDWERREYPCVLTSHDNWVEGAALTADSRRAISGSWDDTLRVWDTDNGACLRTLRGHDGTVNCVFMTPDNRRVVSGSRDKSLRIWDLESGRSLRLLEGHSESVLSVSVTPDGCRVVSGSQDRSVRVWDLETGTCLCALEGHSRSVLAVSVTPDSRCAVSGSEDRTLRVWDLETRACIRILEGHGDSVNCVSVTPDGRLAVSGSDDKTLRIWDLGSGDFLHTLNGHTDDIDSVSVFSGGRYVASGSRDRTFRIWDLKSGECVCVYRASTVVGPVACCDRGMRACLGSRNDLLLIAIHGMGLESDLVPAPKLDLDVADAAYEKILVRGLEACRAQEDSEGAAGHLAALATLRSSIERVDVPLMGSTHPTWRILEWKLLHGCRQRARPAPAGALDRCRATLYLYERSYFRDADRMLSGLLDEGFDDPEILYHLAQIYLVKGDAAAARRQAEAVWKRRKMAPTYVTKCVLWLMLAAALVESAEQPPPRLLGMLKTTMRDCEIPPNWELAQVLRALEMRLSAENQSLLAALLAAFRGPFWAKELDRFDCWRDAAPQRL